MSNSSPIKLHVISWDVPYPPDYGGVIDVFYKIKNLYEQGVEIYLHCFQYGRAQQPVLETYCKQVWYYPRKIGYKGVSITKPYMLYSRRDDQLLENLLLVDAPILFEGVHTTFLLNDARLASRRKIIRNQNVEQEYFKLLGKKETVWFRKMYYNIEGYLLKQWENNLQEADAFFTVSNYDYEFFKHKYPNKYSAYLPSFQPYNQVVSLTGKGNYILYHGNLGHVENRDAVQWLAKHVFPFIVAPIIVAGKSPGLALQAILKPLPHVTLLSNLDNEAMQQLIKEAHIHLIPTFQASGLKLKLLNALFVGRHVVLNDAMLHGTDLKDLCHVANDATTMIESLKRLMVQPFTEKEKADRKTNLKRHYNNEKNAQCLVQYLQS